jgi:ubiquinone/menaquinone biosynthesis C-methylase UbiE
MTALTSGKRWYAFLQANLEGNRPEGCMTMRSTEEWRARARQDPLHAVASHPGTDNNRWDVDAFYELGRSDWADFQRHWEGYLGRPLGGTCLEIGSGAGRITGPLTHAFGNVIGTDVSPAMLQLAGSRAPAAEFLLIEDTALPLPSGSVDAVFSCHVLQHFEREVEVARALREAHRVLRPHGSLMVHLLVSHGERTPLRAIYAEARHQIMLRKRRGQGVTVVRRYHIDTVRELLRSAGFSDIEMREFPVVSNGDPHAFWFARA